MASNDLIDLPLRRVGHRPLLHRCWELRHTVTGDGAAYAALAVARGVVLVIADARLSRGPGITRGVEVLR